MVPSSSSSNGPQSFAFPQSNLFPLSFSPFLSLSFFRVLVDLNEFFTMAEIWSMYFFLHKKFVHRPQQRPPNIPFEGGLFSRFHSYSCGLLSFILSLLVFLCLSRKCGSLFVLDCFELLELPIPPFAAGPFFAFLMKTAGGWECVFFS